jgi:hypothetical protein
VDIIYSIFNTLSESANTYEQNSRPEDGFSHSGKQMLDDQITCRAHELFHPFGSTIPEKNRLLQQFYPQWKMVHAGFDSSIQRNPK